jgi:small conductance mechanosensitive channel
VVDVEVSADSDVDRVMEVLREVGVEIQEALPARVEEPSNVMGIESFTAVGCVIRTVTKTGPGAQWDVARELRRRILMRFRQEGIEMPLPQRVVWNRTTE